MEGSDQGFYIRNKLLADNQNPSQPIFAFKFHSLQSFASVLTTFYKLTKGRTSRRIT